MSEVYTIKEAAAILRCSEWSIYQLCKSKKLKHFKIGSAIRIEQTDIEDFIKKSKRINS